MIDEAFGRLRHFATMERTVDAVRAAFMLALTLVFMRLASRWVQSVVEKKGGAQRAVLAGRLTAWIIFALGITAAVQELGFKIQVLLGAAGVFSVAIGFASQTTLSNVISGFFLFGERPFSIGDTVDIEGIVGEVLSIDLLSTALRTPDRRFVRIPNETLIKTKLTNLTRFSERRLELSIAVANDEPFAVLRERILEIASAEPLCLKEPAPQVFISTFNENSFVILVWAWAKTPDVQALRAALGTAIHDGALGVRRTALPPRKEAAKSA